MGIALVETIGDLIFETAAGFNTIACFFDVAIFGLFI